MQYRLQLSDVSESVVTFSAFSPQHDRPIMMRNAYTFRVASFGKQAVLMAFMCSEIGCCTGC